MQKIGVLGAGTMGAGIAQAFAMALSLIHISEPRDISGSRMPSSA